MEITKKLKIAFCFSGQLRTWHKCLASWLTLKKTLEQKIDAKIDVFCHSWTFNTAPMLMATFSKKDYPDFEYISQDECDTLISSLKPKLYKFHSETFSKNRELQMRELKKQLLGITSENVLLQWSASQFYSLMYSCHLKKQYELDNNFNYDICFRLRYDLFFQDQEIDRFSSIDNFTFPKFNTIYSCHTGLCDQWPFRRLGDIFFYSDSLTFDKINDYYRWIPYIDKNLFKEGVLTEAVFYYFAKMQKINIQPIFVDPKIVRSYNYEKQLQKFAPDFKLGNHEII